IDVGRRKAGLLQAAFSRLLPERDRVFLVFPRERRQGARLDDVVHRVYEEAPPYLGAVHDGHHRVETPFVDGEGASEIAFDVVPGDLVLGERRRRGGNADGLFHVRGAHCSETGRLKAAPTYTGPGRLKAAPTYTGP